MSSGESGKVIGVSQLLNKIDGHFSEDNLEIKGPAKGLSPQFFYDILGKKSKHKIKKGSYLQDDDL